MEDLFPLLIFVVIVAINVIKFFAEKRKPKKPAQPPGEAPPKSSIEAFFESLTEQVAPKPTELPDWPEDRDRPDYIQEMEELERPPIEQPVNEQSAEIVQAHPSATGVSIDHRTDVRIVGRKNLRQAMLAHIVFSPPRAFDLSFKNALVK